MTNFFIGVEKQGTPHRDDCPHHFRRRHVRDGIFLLVPVIGVFSLYPIKNGATKRDLCPLALLPLVYSIILENVFFLYV